jgi:MscS family membrane protein
MKHCRQISCISRVMCLLTCMVSAVVVHGQKTSTPSSVAHKSAALVESPTSQSTPANDKSEAKESQTDPLGRSTPYGCVIGFLQAVNSNDLPLATRYLDTKLPEAQAEQLATELKVVLDASHSSSIDSLSRDEHGDMRDGLRISREKIGVARTLTGDIDILLDHVQREQEPPVWLFASQTLTKIPGAYKQLQPHHLSNSLPPFFSKVQFFGIPLWRWLAILIFLVLALLLSSVVTRLLLLIFRLCLHKGRISHESEILPALRQPIRIILLSLALWCGEKVALSVLARHNWTMAARTLAIIGCAWLLTRVSDLLVHAGMRRALAAGAQARIAIFRLVQRLFKILIAFLALLVLLRSAGINVSAMVAGLGIGGIALALAAQKTLEDLFGGISIIMRDTIRVGDYCRIADQTGTVEDIGLSSTRIRTLDRTVVSIPNAKIAQLSSENFTLRDRFWFHHLLALRFDTSHPQIERVLADIREIMKTNPEFDDATDRVNFVGLEGASFQIEVFAYLKAGNYNAFLARQQELLLKILACVSESGTHLAFPSQTTYLEKLDEVSRHFVNDQKSKAN